MPLGDIGQIINLSAVTAAVGGAALAGWMAWRERSTAAALQNAREEVAKANSDRGNFSGLLEAMTNSLDSCVFVLDEEEHVVLCAGLWTPSETSNETIKAFDDLKACFAQGDGEVLGDLVARCRSGEILLPTRLFLGDGRHVEAGVLLVGMSGGDQLCLVLRDVSNEEQLRRAYELVRREKSEAQFAMGEMAATLQSLALPVWRRDPDLNLVWCNDAYGEIVGLPAREAMTSRTEIQSTTHRASPALLAEKALQKNEAVRELRFTVVNGVRRGFEVTEVPNPVTGGTVGFAEDITRLNEANQEIARLIDAQWGLLNVLTSSVIICGMDKRAIYFNDAYLQLWRLDEDWLRDGPTNDEILEKLRSLRRLPEQADFPAYRAEQDRLFTDLMEPVEELLYLPDGRIIRRVIAPYPLGGLIFADEDVTDVHALERSYNTLIETQKETLDALYEAVAVFGPDARLKLFNPAFAKIWNLEPEFLRAGPHVGEIFNERNFFHDPAKQGEDYSARVTGEVLRREPFSNMIERKDGSIINYSLFPLPDGNNLLVYVDVTDTQKMERFLKERNLALEAADREKTRFLAGISYDLRTPLTAITGFSDMMLQGLMGKISVKQTETLTHIQTAANDLKRQIDRILDLAKIEANRLELSLDQVGLLEIMGQLKQDFTDAARNNDLELLFNLPAHEVNIIADHQRLTQALANILDNAVKYGQPGKLITVSLEEVPNGVCISVADNGVGIPAKDLPHIFDRFQRGSNIQHIRGSGVGLSLARKFIELHNGHLDLSSEPDGGVRVRFVLPANPTGPAVEDKPSAAISRPMESGAGGRNILTLSNIPLSGMEKLAHLVASRSRSGDIFLLRGDLGAGKTTFARYFLTSLGVREEITSPTFTILHEYDGASCRLYHFDLYRLNDERDALELGIEDAFEEGICLVEWPDRLGSLIPATFFELKIEAGPNSETRQLQLDMFNPSTDQIDRFKGLNSEIHEH